MSDFKGDFESTTWGVVLLLKNSLRMVQETCNLPRRLLGRLPMPPNQIYLKTYNTLSHLSPNEPKLQSAAPY